MADDDQRDDADRDAILSRRHRLIAVALTGLVAGTAQACACLSIAVDAGQTADAGEPPDASTDDASVSQDGGPLPCLTPVPPDAGSDSGT